MARKPLRKTHPRQRKRFGPALSREALIFAAEVATLASAGAFFLSVVLNSSIFAVWHISYLQVASASDVVMGGLDLFFRSAPVLIGVLAGYGFHRLTGLAPKEIHLGVTIVLILGGWLINVWMRPFEFSAVTWRDMLGVTVMALSWFASWSFFSSDSKELGLGTVVVVGIASYSVAAFSTVASMTPGFWEPGTAFMANGPAPCRKPIVLWTGSTATIIECPQHRRIVRSDGQQILTPGPAHDTIPFWLTEFIRRR